MCDSGRLQELMIERKMDLDEFQKYALGTAIYPGCGSGTWTQLAYTSLGAAGEAGELANKVKKILRDGRGEVSIEAREALLKEAGDTMWYIALLCHELEASLNEVGITTISKLLQRQQAGSIKGSGDDR